MSEALTMVCGRTEAPRRFYVWMAGVCLAIAVLGFVPTYFLPVANRSFTGEPIVHIHAAILYAWVILFFAQTLLVARGKILAHRSWGIWGIAIVTGMVFIITTLVCVRISQASLPGQPSGTAHAVRAWEWVSFSGIPLLLPMFVLAIVRVRQIEMHRRLMLLFTMSLMGAPIARWFFVFLAPPPDVHAPPPTPGVPQIDVPPVSASIPPALVGDILILAAIFYDWRTRGRPHPVYLIGGAYVLFFQLTVTPISESTAWQSFATILGHLAG
jgi:hypothetical protein